MGQRHEKIGIKQGPRIEWLDYAVNLKLAGLPEKKMRTELSHYISTRLDNGEMGKRGESTTKIAVTMIMNLYGKVSSDLHSLQENALSQFKDNKKACHWAMLCAAYPFWYKVAQQTGRLLNLQEQTNKRQIVQRIKESYGDRSSVVRSAQRVIQGYVGCRYLMVSQNNQLHLSKPEALNSNLTVLLYESALLAEENASLAGIKSSPAFFPFTVQPITGEYISKSRENLDVIRYGLDDEFIKINYVAK